MVGLYILSSYPTVCRYFNSPSLRELRMVACRSCLEKIAFRRGVERDASLCASSLGACLWRYTFQRMVSMPLSHANSDLCERSQCPIDAVDPKKLSSLCVCSTNHGITWWRQIMVRSICCTAFSDSILLDPCSVLRCFTKTGIPSLRVSGGARHGHLH